MKIYLAAGFSVSNVRGLELSLIEKFKKYQWRRLWSFYYLFGEDSHKIVTETFIELLNYRYEDKR